MIKKIFIVVCILLITTQALFFGACSNGGWKLVSSITITTSGIEKTFSSSKDNSFSTGKEITEEEYRQKRTKRDLDNNDDAKIKTLSISEVAKITDGDTHYSYNEPFLKG